MQVTCAGCGRLIDIDDAQADEPVFGRELSGSHAGRTLYYCQGDLVHQCQTGTFQALDPLAPPPNDLA